MMMENVYFFPEICIFLSSSCPPRLYIVVPTVIILHTYLLDRSYTQHIFWLSRLLHTCDIRVFTHSFNDFTVAASHPEHKYTNTTWCINIWKYDNDTCDWIDYYLKYVEQKSGWGETRHKRRFSKIDWLLNVTAFWGMYTTKMIANLFGMIADCQSNFSAMDMEWQESPSSMTFSTFKD